MANIISFYTFLISVIGCEINEIEYENTIYCWDLQLSNRIDSIM